MTAQEWSKFPVEPYINLNPDKAGPTAEYLVEQCRKKDAEIERLQFMKGGKAKPK